MIDASRIWFRPLRESDLPLLWEWLRKPDVARWYGPVPENFAQVQGKYLPRLHVDSNVHCYLAFEGDRPVGYLQHYFIVSEPEYARALDVDPAAVGIDLFIGEDTHRHRGFGPEMLRAFVEQVVFADDRVTCAIIAPGVSNTVAIRAYEKAGFRHVKTVRIPGARSPEHVMMLWPDELDDWIATREGLIPE